MSYAAATADTPSGTCTWNLYEYERSRRHRSTAPFTSVAWKTSPVRLEIGPPGSSWLGIHSGYNKVLSPGCTGSSSVTWISRRGASVRSIRIWIGAASWHVAEREHKSRAAAIRGLSDIDIPRSKVWFLRFAGRPIIAGGAGRTSRRPSSALPPETRLEPHLVEPRTGGTSSLHHGEPSSTRA